ncbi:MAG: hypothetical protein JJV88_03850, partial [Sulfurovum sp.]|nr:hypothetical protein [Sulfurovaceae bacterium]
DLLNDKKDILYKKECIIAYELYLEFIDNNKEFSRYEDYYYYLHIASDYLMIEELLFDEKYTTMAVFKHKSIHRRNHCVNLDLDVQEGDYEKASVVIDKNQLDRLSKDFEVTFRE